jgi:hypothetical protein
VGRRRRLVLTGLVLVACLGVVLGYQLTRPGQGVADSRVFVPSPGFYEKLPESWQTTIGDAYWLYLIQYYGEHVGKEGDGRLDSLPELLDLVTALNPDWVKPYVFGAYSTIDYGDPALGYRLLEEGQKENPDEWRLPFNLGVFAYWFGDRIFPKDSDKDQIAAAWFEKAADLPGALPITRRLAAALYQKGNDRGKAVNIWFQVYGQGDEYSRQTAVGALKELLPTLAERREALDALRETMSDESYKALERALLEG